MNIKKQFFPLSVALGTATFMSCEGVVKDQDQRPNVVFLHIDDLGWTDLGYMGSDYYETPNIDQLSEEGLIFTNAYAGAANSAPSRANLLTGMNSPRHGIYTVNSPDRGHPKTRQLIASANADSIMHDDVTLGHLFRKNGYKTCAIGKWHLSSSPVHNGFHINIGGDNRGNPGRDGYFAPYNIANIEQGPEGEYLTDRLTDEAIQFIEENRESPFFLYMSYYTVHTPLQGKEHVVEKYRQKEGTDVHNNPVYAAMIESMDENVGRILTRLDDFGLTDNTLIVYLSDNGGIRSISRQDPLRAGKGSYYEGGIRVPMILKWSSHIRPGITDEPVTNLDFFPTFMSVLGVEMGQKVLDGDDLTPLFTGGTLEKRPLFWHFPIYLQRYAGEEDQGRDPLFRTRPGSVMRYGKWKLHEYFEDGAIELYNLASDPGETNNLVDTYPEKTGELVQMLTHWREETNAPVPTERNPEYDARFEKMQIERLSTQTFNYQGKDGYAFREMLASMSEETR